MVQNLAGILVTIATIALLLWLVETYFPTVPILVRAVIIASLVLFVIRTLRTWLCSWLCGGA